MRQRLTSNSAAPHIKTCASKCKHIAWKNKFSAGNNLEKDGEVSSYRKEAKPTFTGMPVGAPVSCPLEVYMEVYQDPEWVKSIPSTKNMEGSLGQFLKLPMAA